ncbi:uncharacterized protein LOC122507584 isoform X1 [Leptopilina heterotoma]|uniref:uncharacterized protein LOC122507584 isoform X1 n=2 Tax=Leptopilina heterotoma TaxID=63436 RepID=UPI001CA8B3F4|nr:uncharacterized protein LOC122507584 isoform X1 [Leptopilina heterotoma]
MISKSVEPELNWKQYDVLQYLKRTDTYEKGREKLHEALIMSEIDSDVIDNYSENYKRSRNNRAKVISSPSLQNASIKEVNKLKNIVSTSEKKRQKPQINDEQIQKPRIPLPPMKRIRAGPTETEFATPSLPKNSKQKDFSDTRSPGSTNDLLLNEIRIAKSAIENPISEDSTLRSPKNSIQSDFRSKTFTSNLLPKKIPTDASTIKDSNSDESSTDTDEFAKPGLLENSKHKGFKTKDVFDPSTSTEKMRSLNNFNTASALPDNDNNPNASKSKFSSNLENALASLEYQDSKTET